jgi:uncharacterized membrane protein YdbT with pleckstrin-like domain
MQVNRDDLAIILERSFLFSSLDPQQIRNLIEQSEVVSFKPGQMIYLENSPADSLMVVIEGKVELLKERNFALETVNILQKSDILGFDQQDVKRKRICSARALDNSILIQINADGLEKIESEKSNFKNKLFALHESYKMITSVWQPGNYQSETIYYQTRKHPFALYSKFVFSGLFFLLLNGISFWLFRQSIFKNSNFLLAFLIFSLLFFLTVVWLVYEWKNDVYFITKSRVIAQNRRMLLFDKRIEMPLNKIMNLGNKKSLFGRMFDFGNLTVHTFTGLMRITAIANVDIVQDYLQFLINQNMKMEFAGIDANLQKTKEYDSANSQNEKKAFSGLISRKIMRGAKIPKYQTWNGKSLIHYHTHWINLLVKVSIPTLLLLSEIFALIFLVGNQNFLLQEFLFQLISILFGVSVFCWWMYQYADWRNDIYFITDDEVIDIYRKPFGLEDQRTAPIKNIQSIRYERRGLAGVLFNFGTVYIRIGDDDFTFDNVPNPADVQKVLFDTFEAKLKKENDSETILLQKRMAEWMADFQKKDQTDIS